MGKKDVMNMLEEENKKEKKEKKEKPISIQEKDKAYLDKSKDELLKSMQGFLENSLQYLKVGDVLLLKVSEGIELLDYQLVKIKELEENIKDDDSNAFSLFFKLKDLTRIVDSDYRMCEGKDVDGNDLEIDLEQILLVSLYINGLNRLKIVGSVRVPKGIKRVVKRIGNDEKYLNT